MGIETEELFFGIRIFHTVLRVPVPVLIVIHDFQILLLKNDTYHATAEGLEEERVLVTGLLGQQLVLLQTFKTNKKHCYANNLKTIGVNAGTI
jgi:uncharacterized protein YhhL (DUF1145 family)